MCVYVCVCACGAVGVFVGVCVCGCGVLICFVSTLGSHEMGRHKLPIIIIIITTHHASWRIRQQQSSSTPVCHWPASGWCPRCGSCSSFPLPKFFARLFLISHAAASLWGPGNGMLLSEKNKSPEDHKLFRQCLH